jgi:hypothetical protein
VPLGTSIAMYVAPRAAAFAGILAFLHLSMRACLTGVHRSRNCVQRTGCWALAFAVVVLTLAALVLFMMLSFLQY